MNKKILELKNSGCSIREIARQTGKSTTYVSKTILSDSIKNPISEKEKTLECNEIIFAICKKTGREFSDYKNSGGAITEHIQNTFPEFSIESKFKRKSIEMKTGKFWYDEFFDFKVKKVNLKKCKLCDWETIDIENKSGCYTSHLKDMHGLGIEEYLQSFGDEKHLFKTHVERLELKQLVESSDQHGIQCMVCNEYMRKITNKHLKYKHNMTLPEYREKFGKTISPHSSKLISVASTESNKKVVPKRKNTWIELILKDKIEEVGIRNIPQFGKNGFYYDFFLNDYEMFLEADGLFWHGHDRSEKWYFSQFNNVINDYRKSIGIRKMIRLVEGKSINVKNLNQVFTVDSFFNFLEKENSPIEEHAIFNLKEDAVIFEKEYCRNKEGIFIKEKVDQNLTYLMREFYHPDVHEEFINLNCRSTPESKIKAIFFESFYSARKVGSKNLKETFFAGNNLLKTIQYRLGINKSKELFDVNIKNIYRGIEVRTMFNVGIFPVNQARDIYSKYVGHGQLVFDPFAGWGSRMLGASGVLENNSCTYIGFDTNTSLERPYSILKNEFMGGIGERAQIHIRDSRVHEPILKSRVDFIFTSPPFYNDEIYQEDQKQYASIEEWTSELLMPVFANCYEYLKSGKYMLIDMKAKYGEALIKAAEESGFAFHEKEQYKVKKSHYAKQEKFQETLIFFRP